MNASKEHIMLNLYSILIWMNLEGSINMVRMLKSQCWLSFGLSILWAIWYLIFNRFLGIIMECLMFFISKTKIRQTCILKQIKCQKKYLIFILWIQKVWKQLRLRMIKNSFHWQFKITITISKNMRDLFSIYKNLVKSYPLSLINSWMRSYNIPTTVKKNCSQQMLDGWTQIIFNLKF